VNVTKGVKKFLEESGEDVVTLIELGLRRLLNGEVLIKARELNRILLTYDKGFLNITHGAHPGVVIVRIFPNFDDIVIPAIKELLNEINNKHITNYLIIVETGKLKIRKTD
jgi:predicted nuclease of predicted toxin-antitoxin system